MSWEIKSKTGEVKAVIHSVEYNDEWMQEYYVTATIESPTPIDFQIGDYLEYRGERFEINYDPGKIKSAPRFEKGDAFKYNNVKFNSLADELTRCDFLDYVLNDNGFHFTGLPKFSFYGNVRNLADRIQANLNKTYGENTWHVVIDEEFADNTELNVAVDTIKVSGALEKLVNDFKTYYTIKGRTITIGAAAIPADHLFKYGKDNGLYEIEQNAEADQQIVTRLRAYGSTRNMPYRYYNSLTGADGKKLIPDNMAVQYLMLPEFPYTTQDPYLDSKNIDALGIREGTIFFDGSGDLPEIYPSIEGMTAEQLKAAGVPCNAVGEFDVLVSAEQMTDDGVGEIVENGTQTDATPPTFKVTVKDLGFDINDYVIAGNGETPTVSFKSGKLGGRDFEIVKCDAIKDNSGKITGYELELNRVYDDGIQLWFPYKDYNAAADDKFVLLYIAMPEAYIKAASQRLKEEAQKWLDKNDYSRSVYNPKIDEIFMARQHDLALASGGSIKSLHDTLRAGMQLLFEDDDLGIDAAIFIDRLTIKEGESPIPTYEVVLKEEKTVGTLQKMQNQIDSLAAGQGQGNGGYTASQIRSLIKAYGGEYFLSKIFSDVAKGKITFEQGAEFGEFISGLFGKGAKIDANGYGEFQGLKVNGFMEVMELIVNRLSAIEGDQLLTEADTIESLTKNADGTYDLILHPKHEGYFTAQAEGNVIKGIYNTLGQGGGSYYTSWMRVNTVNRAANRINVSLYGDEDVPGGKNYPPVEMMRFARWGNQTDEKRQSCIYLSSTEGRIVKLTGVTKPIIEEWNYGATIGTVPEFLKEMGLPIVEGRDYLYADGLITKHIIYYDKQGRPIPTIVDRGLWRAGESYYYLERNPETDVFETSAVWYYACRWECRKSGTTQEPRWDSTDWAFTQGNPNFTVEFEPVNTTFRASAIDMTLQVVTYLYNQDITDDILDADVEWTRYSEDADGNPRPLSDNLWATAHAGAGKSVHITTADIDWNGGRLPKKVRFFARATLRDGRTDYATMNLIDIN